MGGGGCCEEKLLVLSWGKVEQRSQKHGGRVYK